MLRHGQLTRRGLAAWLQRAPAADGAAAHDGDWDRAASHAAAGTSGGSGGVHLTGFHSSCRSHDSDQAAAAAGAMLLRQFIHHSLYHPVQGYFSRPSPPVGRLPDPINFKRLVGQGEYRTLLDRLYRELQVDWLTPVEIFRPWYGAALAHYMLELRQHGGLSAAAAPSAAAQAAAAGVLDAAGCAAADPLAIIEIGGGTGTLAASILDHIRERAPQVYATMTYTTLEISAPLAAAQRRVVEGEAGHANGVWRCIVGDAADPTTWHRAAAEAPAWQHKRYGGTLAGQHCFVLAMEVLDNMPHDRVVRPGPDADWQQTLVAPSDSSSSSSSSGSGGGSHGSRWQEQLAPVTDPLVARCVDMMRAQDAGAASAGGNRPGSWLQRLLDFAVDSAGPSIAFLPTACLALLDTLHACRPEHTLLAADFDSLPDIRIAGKAAPLVSSRPAPGRVQDHSTLYVPWGSADIFFPTDFQQLAALYMEAGGRAAGGGAGAAQQEGSCEAAAARGAAGGGSGGGDGRHLDAFHLATGDFLSRFAVSKNTRTLSGWNPMVQDWPNTRLFVGSSRQRAAAAQQPGGPPQ